MLCRWCWKTLLWSCLQARSLLCVDCQEQVCRLYDVAFFSYPIPPSFLPYPSFPPREVHSGSPTGTFLRPPTRVCPAGRPPPVLPGPLMGEERSGWFHSPGTSALRYISDGEHTLWPTFRHRPRGQRSNCARLCYVGGYEQLVTTVHLFSVTS